MLNMINMMIIVPGIMLWISKVGITDCFEGTISFPVEMINAEKRFLMYSNLSGILIIKLPVTKWDLTSRNSNTEKVQIIDRGNISHFSKFIKIITDTKIIGRKIICSFVKTASSKNKIFNTSHLLFIMDRYLCRKYMDNNAMRVIIVSFLPGIHDTAEVSRG